MRARLTAFVDRADAETTEHVDVALRAVLDV
jgi:hypothetical protein